MWKLFYVQVVHYFGVAFAALITVYFRWCLKGLVKAMCWPHPPAQQSLISSS